MIHTVVCEWVTRSKSKTPFRYVNDESNISLTNWLAKYPHAPYTTVRTLHTKSILDLPSHIHRLAASFEEILTFDKVTDDVVIQESYKNLKSINIQDWLKFIYHSIHLFLKVNEFKTSNEELKICLLIKPNYTQWTRESPSIILMIHIDLLPKVPSSCQVKLIPFKMRPHPKTKDTQWALERQVLENQKTKNINEIIMIYEDHCIYEGTQSNFFAIFSDGSLHTAPKDSVLNGTIMNCILELCQKMSIKIIFEPIQMTQITKLRAAFITSISRLLLPIDTIILPSNDKVHLSTDDALLENLQRSLLEFLETKLTEIPNCSDH